MCAARRTFPVFNFKKYILEILTSHEHKFLKNNCLFALLSNGRYPCDVYTLEFKDKSSLFIAFHTNGKKYVHS